MENPLDYNVTGFERLKEKGKKEWHILNEFLRATGRGEIGELDFYSKVDDYLSNIKDTYIKKDDSVGGHHLL